MLRSKNNKTNDNKDNKDKISFADILMAIAVGLVIGVSSMLFIRVSKVTGHSMDNTLYDGPRLLINVFTKNIERGDIVVVERPDLSVRYLIKRVIAVGGDTIEIKDNVVYINGEAIQEDYIKEPMYTVDYPIKTIPEGKVFIMGDNRNNSMDSRTFTIGLIDVKEEVIGEAFFSISGLEKVE